MAALALTACADIADPVVAVDVPQPQFAVVSVPGDFSSIQDAVDAASSGDVIVVAPGTYTGQITITKAITLASEFLTSGDEGFIASTILDGGGGAFVIEIPSGAEDGATIRGFTIQNALDGITPRARFNLLNCRVHNATDGVDYESGSGGLVQFCTFELNDDDGLDLDDDVDLTIVDNVIRHNGGDGIELRMQAYNGPPLNITVDRNQIYGNRRDGIQLIHYDVLTDRFFQITNNLFYDNGSAGIGMMDGAETTEDFRGASIPETIHIFNNTFSGNGHGITGGDNTVVVNNIFVGHPDIAVKNVDGNSELAFNLFFNNGTDDSGSNVDVGSSVYVDPFLTTDFRLPPGSPAIDAGTASFVWQGSPVLDLQPDEYSGAAPDLGAFEFDFGSGAPPDPPQLIAPSNGESDVFLTPTLSWTGEGDSFLVYIAEDAAFSSVISMALVQEPRYTVPSGTLLSETTYYWRVNSSTANGTSPFSDPWSFTTARGGALDVWVASSTDDAEEDASGGISLTSSDLELVFDGDDQTVGMRFNAVAIPAGATIIDATIQFQADETHTGATSLTIQGEAIDDAPTFSNTDHDVSSRGRTTAFVSWSPPPWETRGEASAAQQTPDIAPVVQEIVSRPGWVSGNSMAVIITGTGERAAESYDGNPGGAPLLHVDYVLGPPPVNQAPTASFTAATSDLTATFTDTSTDPDGDATIQTWAWTFGDGNTSSAQHPSHTYASAGTYAVTLTVTDDGGLTSTATQDVTVSDPPSIVLTVIGTKERGLQKADLAWTSIVGDTDIYRDGVLIATVGESPFRDAIDQRGQGTYLYQVCVAGSATECSAVVTLEF